MEFLVPLAFFLRFSWTVIFCYPMFSFRNVSPHFILRTRSKGYVEYDNITGISRNRWLPLGKNTTNLEVSQTRKHLGDL